MGGRCQLCPFSFVWDFFPFGLLPYKVMQTLLSVFPFFPNKISFSDFAYFGSRVRFSPCRTGAYLRWTDPLSLPFSSRHWGDRVLPFF